MALEDTGNAVVKFADGWSQIKEKAISVLENFLLNGCEGESRIFKMNECIEMYTLCYNMSTQRPPDNCSVELYRAHAETFANFLGKEALPLLKAKLHTNEYFLRELCTCWKNHLMMNKWMKKFFMYLDRFHAKFGGLPTLVESADRIFKSIIYEAIKKEATAAILSMIEQDRCGVMEVDRSLIWNSLELYIFMGMNSTECYVPDFELACLEATRDFYVKEVTEWVKSENVASYLLKVEQSIENESRRCKQYLHAETEAKLLCVVEEECLTNKMSFLFDDRAGGTEGSDCRSLFLQDAYEDLHRMFTLFSRLPTNTALIRLSDLLSKHISEQGSALIERQVQVQNQGNEAKDGGTSSAGPPKKAPSDKDDPAFVQSIIALHDKYASIIKVHFNSHIQFQKALKDAFVSCMNKDVGKVKFADFLCTYSNRLLSAGGSSAASGAGSSSSSSTMSEQEIEAQLENVVGLFTYLVDKDYFNEVYRNDLAKRLLHQKSASDEMERVMVGKLKLKCGNNFTSKLEGMLNDFTIGVDHQQQFLKYCSEMSASPLGKTEVAVTVLTHGHWPSYKMFEKVHLPAEITTCMKVFQEFYDKQFNHRKLLWVHSLGAVQMRSTFGGKHTYEIQMTNLQAVVLLLFNLKEGENSRTTKSFEQIMEATNMPDEVLKRVLHSLSCGKLKLLRRASGETGSDAAGAKADGAMSKGIKNTDIFSVNDAFTSPSRKFRVPMASLDGAETTSEQLVDQVNESREFVIDSALVRIMKIRKQLGIQQLIAEVVSQLNFFSPQPKAIKKRIEGLIEREYLERDSNDPSVFKYLA